MKEFVFKISFFPFFFLLTASDSIIFYDNFQNSQESFSYHYTSQSQEMTIIQDTDSYSSRTSTPFSGSTKSFGERYVKSLGNSGCPLLSDGRCGIYYRNCYDCSCGCSGCSTCCDSGYYYCDCPQNFAYHYEFFYLDLDITTQSISQQFQITFEAKGSGTLDLLAIFPINSCPSSFVTMIHPQRGKYALAPSPIQEITLSSDYKIFTIIYSHADYGCSLKVLNTIMIGFNQGPFTIKNLVVSNPEKPVSEDFLLAKNGFFYIALYVAENRIVDTVSYINYNSIDLASIPDRFDSSIKTLIGPRDGNSILFSFNEVVNIKANGPNNNLTCGITNSHLWGGSSNTVFIIKNIPGQICYIENFNIAEEDIINVDNFDHYHNFSQIERFFDSSCGEDCLNLTMENSQIIFHGLTMEQSSTMSIHFSPSPCFDVCPDCRIISDCAGCQNCVPGLCDLEGCHQCNDPFFVSLSKCAENCPSGSFIDFQNMKCFQCNIDFCIECSKDFQCKICLKDTFLYKFICLQTCPEKTYFSLDSLGRNICVDCKENCNVCSYDGCLNCADGFYKFLDLEGDGLYKCIPSNCQQYNKDLKCADIPNTEIEETNDDLNKRKLYIIP